MLRDETAFQRVPMDMLHLETFPSGGNTHQQATVDGDTPDTIVRAGNGHPHDHVVVDRCQIVHLHAPIREGGVDVSQHAEHSLASDRNAVIACVLGEERARSDNVAGVEHRMVATNDLGVRSRRPGHGDLLSLRRLDTIGHGRHQRQGRKRGERECTTSHQLHSKSPCSRVVCAGVGRRRAQLDTKPSQPSQIETD